MVHSEPLWGSLLDGSIMRPEHIIIHHSLTKDSETVSWNAIRRFHVHENNWDAIGYHSGLELINDRYEVIVGRMWNQYGAHCPQDNMNTRSLGICFIGNFDQTTPPQPQWDLGVKFVKSLLNIYDIPVARVNGHNIYNHLKTCPGRKFDMAKFRAELKGDNL